MTRSDPTREGCYANVQEATGTWVRVDGFTRSPLCTIRRGRHKIILDRRSAEAVRDGLTAFIEDEDAFDAGSEAVTK